VTGHLADTSVFIAAEQRRPLGAPPPGDTRVSVATLTELGVGVQRATDPAVRQGREATLARARRFLPLSYDERVGDELAVLLARARTTGRRAGLFDAIIAATALTHDFAVWTRDDDFDVLAELEPRLVVHKG
jgi:predicted nucleic acid-binding protein